MKILPPLQEEDNMIAALSYPFWFVVSWLVLLSHKKEEPFVKFHAIQSLLFGIFISFASLLLIAVLWGVFQLVPSIGKMLSGEVWKGYMWKGLFFIIILTIFYFIFIVGCVIVYYYAYRAYKGDYFKIPIIGNMIENRYFKYLIDEESLEAKIEEKLEEKLKAVARRETIIDKLSSFPFDKGI